MDLYSTVSQRASKRLTLAYSSSFGLSSRLFGSAIKLHIYNIYGLVRVADEIVDTYAGKNSSVLLDELEQDTYRAMECGYSANIIVHAFAITARACNISQELVEPFFQSMRMDLEKRHYTRKEYRQYIYGSAEVVGLLCLKVFCQGDDISYKKLEKGAARLGAAYQKVNFLRDLAADNTQLERFYFPDTTYEAFDDVAKQAIINDIKRDFKAANRAIEQLPRRCRLAVRLSYVYYFELTKKLEQTSVVTLKKQRLRIPVLYKLALLFTTCAKESVR